MEFCPMSTDENNKRNATPKPIAPPPKKSPSYMYMYIHGSYESTSGSCLTSADSSECRSITSV